MSWGIICIFGSICFYWCWDINSSWLLSLIPAVLLPLSQRKMLCQVQRWILTSCKNNYFCKAFFFWHLPIMILYFMFSYTREDVADINLTSVRLGSLTANGREIHSDLVSRKHSKLGRHHHRRYQRQNHDYHNRHNHHQPHRHHPHHNIDHQNHNWDDLYSLLSDPSPIIGNACHSLPNSLTP